MSTESFVEELVKIFNSCVDLKEKFELEEDFHAAAGLCYCLDILNRLIREYEKEYM